MTEEASSLRHGVAVRVVEAVERALARRLYRECLAGALVTDRDQNVVRVGAPQQRDFDSVCHPICQLDHLRLPPRLPGRRMTDCSSTRCGADWRLEVRLATPSTRLADVAEPERRDLAMLDRALLLALVRVAEVVREERRPRKGALDEVAVEGRTHRL